MLEELLQQAVAHFHRIPQVIPKSSFVTVVVGLVYAEHHQPLPPSLNPAPGVQRIFAYVHGQVGINGETRHYPLVLHPAGAPCPAYAV